MARPLRLEFAGALYHVTARGDRQEPIVEDDTDRLAFVDLLAKEVTQQGWLLHAFCLMDNHYHLLVETPEPNLVRGMRRFNGVYTQAFNRRHRRAGHVLQGRYKAILVEKQTHLLELCRYVVLNPLRAGMTRAPGDWPWSSYLATAGKMPCPHWLAADAVLSLFATQRSQAQRAYVRFVAQGSQSGSPWAAVKGQIFLGSDPFVTRMEQLLGGHAPRGISRKQLAPLRPGTQAVLKAVAKAHQISTRAVLERHNAEAFRHAVYLLRRRANLPLQEVAALAGVSSGRVSQIQSAIERNEPNAHLRQCLEAL
jgi:REP element-mobilizing transposase RayT